MRLILSLKNAQDYFVLLSTMNDNNIQIGSKIEAQAVISIVILRKTRMNDEQ